MKKKIVSKKSKQKSGGKSSLLGGALVGAALGIAAGMLLAPESGKKARRDVKKLSGEFYNYVASRAKKLKRVGEAEYNAFVAKSMKDYAKAKRLSLAERKVITMEAKRSWKHIKKHLR